MIIHDVEQNSDAWHQLRSGIPTASMFNKILTPKKCEISKQLYLQAMILAADVWRGDADQDMWEGNEHTKRGHELESEAISAYEFINECTVERVGFITNDEKTSGCSPDGLVGDDLGVEVKCLKAENHINAIVHHELTGTLLPEYKLQVQGSMMLTNRNNWDSIFYHPEFPTLIIRSTHDRALTNMLSEGIEMLIKKRDEVLEILNRCKLRGHNSA